MRIEDREKRPDLLVVNLPFSNKIEAERVEESVGYWDGHFPSDEHVAKGNEHLVTIVNFADEDDFAKTQLVSVNSAVEKYLETEREPIRTFERGSRFELNALWPDTLIGMTIESLTDFGANIYRSQTFFGVVKSDNDNSNYLQLKEWSHNGAHILDGRQQIRPLTPILPGSVRHIRKESYQNHDIDMLERVLDAQLLQIPSAVRNVEVSQTRNFRETFLQHLGIRK